MVAVSAAAHSIDALYGEISPLIPVPEDLRVGWDENRTRRPMRIFETLKLGCQLGRRTNDWPKKFRHVYLLRDALVHHETTARATVPHPSGKTRVGKENADYSLENATESLDLALDVVKVSITQAKAPRLREWASTMAHVPGQLEAQRSS